jgi:hypothetical protein
LLLFAACIEEKRDEQKIISGKHERKRLLGRHRRRWVHNIKLDLKHIGCQCVDWIQMTHDRVQ